MLGKVLLCRPGAGPLHPLLVVVKVSKDQKDRIELDTFDYRSKNKIELDTFNYRPNKYNRICHRPFCCSESKIQWFAISIGSDIFVLTNDDQIILMIILSASITFLIGNTKILHISRVG